MAKKKKVRIAVVQFKSLPEVEDNLKKAERFIKTATEKKANIIVFPEAFLSKPTKKREYFIDDKNFTAKYFQKLAKKYKIDIVPGSVITRDKGKLYNTAYYINSKGKIKCTYRKIHLWLSERKSFYSGNEVKVFSTDYGKIGLIICWDLAFPEMFRKMVMQNAKIVICPSNWSFGDAGKGLKYDRHSEIKLIDSLCTYRAFEQEIILVYSNTAGKLKEKGTLEISIGHSQVTQPFKGVVKKLNHNKEEMFVAEVNTNILKDAESSYKIRSDLKKMKKLKVSQIMKKLIVSDTSINVKQAAQLMKNKKIGSLIIMKNKKIAGIITERDILENLNNLDKKITSVMSKKFYKVNKNESLDSVITMMAKKKIKRIPVVDKGKPVGIVTSTDILAFKNSKEFTL